MKMNERSSATSAPHQLAQLLDDEAPDLLAHLVVAGAVRAWRDGGAGPGLRLCAPRLQLVERPERHGRVVDVGDLRPVHEVPRLEVAAQRAAPEEAGADRHRGRQARL